MNMSQVGLPHPLYLTYNVYSKVVFGSNNEEWKNGSQTIKTFYSELGI